MTVIVVSFRCGNGKARRGSRIPVELLVSVVLSHLVGIAQILAGIALIFVRYAEG